MAKGSKIWKLKISNSSHLLTYYESLEENFRNQNLILKN